MKKLVLILVLVGMVSCSNEKIAYVNFDEVMEEYEGTKIIEAKMQQRSMEISQELNQLGAQFQQKYQDYQANTSKLSQAERTRIEQELMQENQMIQQRQQMVQQQFQQEGNRIIDSLNTRVSEIVGEYAKKNSIAAVLGTTPQTNSVIYGNDALNITDDVVEYLNSQIDTDKIEEALTEEVSEETVKVDSIQ